ncbi:M20 family metallo-hydrolase [Thioclava sp. BHET1]|nr:M20 family metallo-hydrolase [Thioclava sp. BHET1]
MTSRPFTPEALFPSAGRLAALVEEFAAFGALPGGGVSRMTASAADGEARDHLRARLLAAGAEHRVDAVGNQFGLFRLRSAGTEPDAAPIMFGSHLDSQPRGGRIDGALGVCAAVLVGEMLLAAHARGVVFARDFCVVNWTNEEGARYRPSLLGSGTFCGRHTSTEALQAVDDSGITLEEALLKIGYRGEDRMSAPAAYLELHAEQGPLLEAAGRSVGIVTRNWGAAKFEITYIGEQTHTGPTPMARRRDALYAAGLALTRLRDLADRSQSRLHPSVADAVTFSAELRSSDDGCVAEAEAAAMEIFADAARQAGVDWRIEARSLREGRAMDPAMVAVLKAACERANETPMLMETVAGHDAVSLLGFCPSGLLFAPSVGGITHNEAEATQSADMDRALRVLVEAAFGLCRVDAGRLMEQAE